MACGTEPCQGTVATFKKIRKDIVSLKKDFFFFFLDVVKGIQHTGGNSITPVSSHGGQWEVWVSPIIFFPCLRCETFLFAFLSTGFGFTIIKCISRVVQGSYGSLASYFQVV